ncbi:GNAT family N-acetyltransferase [Natronoglycomyces albus]|uniref:GNAT family N-acetyltransferase n=1 Tax=Natronoglycomyces albus TaxID=2811108 RepID=A0A895XUN7_9ACTN|nr:N-acetyltransferase [Natronoglycomyces albus]QSB05368.1 GNAT family N-acetyltransferase [Natronoglycomyces albus]
MHSTVTDGAPGSTVPHARAPKSGPSVYGTIDSPAGFPATTAVLVDPPVTAALVDELSDLWVRVTNAGGSVGFVPPVDLDRVRPHTVSILTRVIDQTDTLVALREVPVSDHESAGSDSLLATEQKGDAPIVAWCVLTANDSPPRRGWRTVRHVQVDPARQGQGLGSRLLAAVDLVAKDHLGLTALTLNTRSGTGADAFYRREGYREVGRLPRAVRISDDDYRDDIIMWKEMG